MRRFFSFRHLLLPLAVFLVIGCPSLGQAQLGEAQQAFDRKDWKKAEAQAGNAIAAHPTDDAYRIRGWARYRMKDYAGGRTDFQQALALVSTDYEAVLGLGRCNRLLEHYDDALADFTRAHELQPTSARPLCERGAILILQEKWDASLADYVSAEKVEPNYPGLYSYFAEIYLYTHRPAEALAAAQKGLAREPDALIYRINIAHSLLFLGRFDEAKQLYLQLKNVIDPTKEIPGSAIVLKDFGLMKKAHVVAPGMDQIETLMKA